MCAICYGLNDLQTQSIKKVTEAYFSPALSSPLEIVFPERGGSVMAIEELHHQTAIVTTNHGRPGIFGKFGY